MKADSQLASIEAKQNKTKQKQTKQKQTKQKQTKQKKQKTKKSKQASKQTNETADLKSANTDPTPERLNKSHTRLRSQRCEETWSNRATQAMLKTH
jgi:hypothetical protein